MHKDSNTSILDALEGYRTLTYFYFYQNSFSGGGITLESYSFFNGICIFFLISINNFLFFFKNFHFETNAIRNVDEGVGTGQDERNLEGVTISGHTYIAMWF